MANYAIGILRRNDKKGRVEGEVVEVWMQAVVGHLRRYNNSVWTSCVMNEGQLPSAMRSEAGADSVFDRRWKSRKHGGTDVIAPDC